VTFALLVSAFLALVQLAHRFINEVVTAWNANAAAAILRLLGVDARADGTHVISPICSFEVIGECTAFFPVTLFVAAVLAYPSGWRPRATGMIAGTLVILTVNELRLVSLCYVSRWLPGQEQTAHVAVWQPLMVFVVALIWVTWATVVVPRHGRKSA
jgi:exosortase/archaeosortase family protein